MVKKRFYLVLAVDYLVPADTNGDPAKCLEAGANLLVNEGGLTWETDLEVETCDAQVLDQEEYEVQACKVAKQNLLTSAEEMAAGGFRFAAQQLRDAAEVVMPAGARG